MAKVYGPLHSDEASGKAATMVYGTWRGAPVARKHVVPKNPRTPAQLVVRANLTYIMQNYKTLTSVQVSAWAALAATKKKTNSAGGSYTIDSANIYAALNALGLLLGTALQTSPPSVSPAATVELLASGNPATGIHGIKLTPTLIGTGSASDWLDIWISKASNSPNRVATNSEYVRFGQVAGNAANLTIAPLTTGMYYYAQVRYVDQYGQPTGFAKIPFMAVTGP